MFSFSKQVAEARVLAAAAACGLGWWGPGWVCIWDSFGVDSDVGGVRSSGYVVSVVRVRWSDFFMWNRGGLVVDLTYRICRGDLTW